MVKNDTNVLILGTYNPLRFRTGQYLSPSLGPYRIASHIKDIANVVVVDPTLNYKKTIQKIKERNWDIIGHSVLHPTLKHDLGLIYEAHKSSPNSLQVAGGQGAAFNADLILQQTPVKAVVKKYGEFPLEEIIHKHGKFEDVKGLYLKKDSRIHYTGDSEKLTLDKFKEISMNLDFGQIPYEEYWGFMENQYDAKHIDAMNTKGLLKTVRLMVSNYCPMGCTHCTSTEFLKGERLSFLEPNEIISMMERAGKAHPETEAFYFNDDNFLLLGKKKISEFCGLTSSLEKKYNLLFQGRVDEVDKETLSEMAQAGFKIAFYGVETFSDKLARGIRKRNGVENYEEIARQTIENTLDAGVVAQFSLMLFLPRSNQEDLETTIENSVNLMEKGANVTVFPYVEAYAGSKITKEGHEINYDEFEIEGNHFKIPQLILPDDLNIRKLAKKSLELKENLNQEQRWNKFSGKVPQPVDTLNLFYAVKQLCGKNVSKIEKMLKNY